MTRAAWEQQHRKHHPHQCRFCYRRKTTRTGNCTGCANDRHNRLAGTRRAA